MSQKMFKPELKEEINQRLQEFVQVEMGNRITINNWNWLIVTLGLIFERNEVEAKEPEKS